MSDTFCTVCGIDYYSVYCLKKHLTSKKHYKKANHIEGFPCECGKTYRSRQNRHNHRAKCRVYQELKKKKIADSNTTSSTVENTDNNDQLLLRIEQLEKDIQIKDLQLEIAQLKATNVTNNSINNSNNTTNNITNNITINSFGNENIDYISTMEKIKHCKEVYNSFQSFLKDVHFHPDHPENHNVKLPNKKEPYCQIMRDNKWEYAPKDKTLSTMKRNARDELSDTYQANKRKFTPRNQDRFEDFLEKYDNGHIRTNKCIDEDITSLLLNSKK